MLFAETWLLPTADTSDASTYQLECEHGDQSRLDGTGQVLSRHSADRFVFIIQNYLITSWLVTPNSSKPSNIRAQHLWWCFDVETVRVVGRNAHDKIVLL